MDANGSPVHVMGVTELMEKPFYQRMTDEEKAEAISGVVAAAKTGAVGEMKERIGATEKAQKSSEYQKQPVRAIPEYFRWNDAEPYRKLSERFDKTGDGAFIPKAISTSFTQDGVSYKLTGEDADNLWKYYDFELAAALDKVDWDKSDSEVAADVAKAYTSAQSAAKKRWLKMHGQQQ